MDQQEGLIIFQKENRLTPPRSALNGSCGLPLL